MNSTETLFVKILKILIGYRKVIITTMGLLLIAVTIIAFLLPKWYKGSITILFNEDKAASIFSSITEGAIPSDFFGKRDSKVSQYIRFLKSRRVMDKLDKKYNLQSSYDIENRQKFYKALQSNLNIIDNDDKSLTINFYYEENPKLAAEIANSIFSELHQLSLDLKQEKHRTTINSLERVYREAVIDMESIEQKFIEFQAEHQIFNIENQLEALIKQIADLELLRIQTEIERNFLANSLHRSDKAIKSFDTKIRVLDEKITHLKFNDENKLSLKGFSKNAIQYLSLYRDVEIKHKVIDFLVLELEQTRVNALKTTSDIQLLDKAIPEDHKTKPKRLNIILAVMFVSFVFLFFILTLIDLKKRNWETIKKTLAP
jgi:uncharacterized protein involved in exopolysaccharide biosynthesis